MPKYHVVVLCSGPVGDAALTYRLTASSQQAAEFHACQKWHPASEIPLLHPEGRGAQGRFHRYRCLAADGRVYLQVLPEGQHDCH